MADTPTTPQTSPAQAQPADAQLRAAVYYAVGAATEGVKSAYKLAIAAKHRSSDNTILPNYNSGYTVGTLQTDLGQRPKTAQSLVEASQMWAKKDHPDWLLDRQAEQRLIAQLQRTGDVIKAELPNGRGHDIDPVQKERINEFLSSSSGQDWLSRQDKNQLDKLMGKSVDKMKRTHLYQSSTPDDKIRLAVVAAKAFNQNEQKSEKVIAHANDADVKTFDGFMTKVQNDRAIKNTPALRTGIAQAGQAAEVVVALRNANDANPLKPMWAQIEQDPVAVQNAAVRSLFIEYQNGAPELIAAHNHGQPYPATSRGRDIPPLATDGHNLLIADQIDNKKIYTLGAGQAATLHPQDLHWSATNAGHTRDLQLTQDGQTQTALQHMPVPKERHRLWVTKGQQILQSEKDGAWIIDQKKDNAGALKPGLYSLYTAKAADKKNAYTGMVVHADAEKVYQQVGKRFVVHDRADFNEVPDIGSAKSISYDAQGKANVSAAAAINLSRGRSR